MEIINVNEAQFLSSLKQGRRVIDRTLNKMDRDAVEFPGKTLYYNRTAHERPKLHPPLGSTLRVLHVLYITFVAHTVINMVIVEKVSENMAL